MNPHPISIYIHIPFCISRCGYCDFNTYAGKEHLIPVYIEALCKEIELVFAGIPEKQSIHTIFFGGGTPSILTSKQLEAIILTIRKNANMDQNAEISMEANPGSIKPGYFSTLNSIGINRLSLGVQSLAESELRYLGRIHGKQEVYETYNQARDSGFENINMDLIFGIPGQKISTWNYSVNEVIIMDPEHISMYSLTIEDKTQFGKWFASGVIEKPDEDISAEMMEWGSKKLRTNDFIQYEISNYSKVGDECRHNLQYWRNQPYLGFGVGAHGFFGGYRVANVRRINDYISRIKNTSLVQKNEDINYFSPASIKRTRLNWRTQLKETMMLGLRLTKEGISKKIIHNRFHVDFEEYFYNEIKELINQDLVEWHSDQLVLTKRGRLLGNRVFVKFV